MTSPDHRQYALQQWVALQASRGGRVEFVGPDTAVVAFGSKPNHILHLLLTLFTCGLWAIVWIVVAAANRETRLSAWVDESGQVHERQA